MPKDYYQTLGLERGASPEDIKRAYRKQSKEWHPDKHKGDKEAEKKFKEINEAYEVLHDEKKKRSYDRFGTAGGPGGPGGSGGFDFSGFNAEGFGGIGDIFEQFFGGAARRPREERGRDMEVQIAIPFSDAVEGAKRSIDVEALVACDTCDGSGAAKDSKIVTCSACGGTGQITRMAQSFFGTLQQSVLCETCRGSGKVPEHPCKSCGGEGRKRKRRTIDVNIPAGIQDGQSLRVRGQGEAGRQGTAAGDLFVHIRIEADPKFQRDGDDIRTELTIAVVDAILGTDVPVQTVQGSVTLKIPAGTQPNQVFRIKGKGMPVLNASRHGDHYVTVHVEIPTKLSREERKLIEEWKDL